MTDKLKYLRDEAERILNENRNLKTDVPLGDFNRVVHDLKVYQIELELQNEELRNTQKQNEDARNRYAQLYNQAPAGYVTLNQNSIILQANQTFTEMINIDLAQVVNSSFADYLVNDDRSIFLSRYHAFFKKPADKNMELKMIKKGGKTFYVRITGSLKTDQTDENSKEVNQPKLFLIISDITKQKNAEKSLIESEYNYRTLADSGQALIWTSDKDKLCNYFNKVWVNFTGRSLEQEIGNGWAEGVHPDDFDHCLQTYITAFDKQENFSMEYRLRRRDGEYRWLQDDGCPRYNSNGDFMGYIGYCLDITERKLAEAALSESETKYRDIIEQTGEGVMLINEQGTIIEWNRAQERITGISKTDALGQPAWEVQFNQMTAENKKQFPKDTLKTIITDILSTGNALQFAEPFEFQAVSPSGQLRDRRQHSFLIKTDNGHRIAIFSHDVTEQKLTEQAVKESDAKYKRIVETAIEGILSFDRDFKITFVNQQMADMLGYKVVEMLGRKYESFISDDQLSDHAIQLKNRIQGQDAVYERCFLRKDGQKHWVLVSDKAVIDSEGKFAGSFGMFTDINDRKSAEAELHLKNIELQKLNVEKDKFFSIVAHDLRSPFNGFLGLTHLMAEELPTLSRIEIQGIAVSMRNSASNLYRLIENLLHWARIQQGLIPFDPEELNLLPIITESMEMLSESAKSKGIAISYDIPSDLRVQADANMMKTIVRNLVSNAVKFTPKGGKITLAAKADTDQSVQISIKDTGIGMNSEIVENLFKLDGKTGRAGTEGEASTGLGLMLCKEFVEKHGGNIWVESEVGKGSTFAFTRPDITNADDIG